MKNIQIENTLQNFKIESFRDGLISWFQAEKRDLPWRKNQDPYQVWVSEITLQQTKVDTVIPYYQNFMAKFPTLQDLADADEQTVLKAWEGLGYYSRARNLQNAVREVVSTYESKVPDEPKSLASLKGVGPYTKGAILSIAYDLPEPAVDGNVMRVLSRVLKIDEDIAKQSARRLFEAHVKELISVENPSDFNQGLMELGALICTPKSPSCLFCPVQSHCRAFAEGIEQELPIKSKAKKQKTVPYLTFIIANSDGEYLIEKRPEQGLLANLWQFPMAPMSDIDLDNATHWFYGEYGVQISLGNKIDKIKHVFSHVIWELEVYSGIVKTGELDHERSRFVPKEELVHFPFSVSHQKMLKHTDIF